MEVEHDPQWFWGHQVKDQSHSKLWWKHLVQYLNSQINLYLYLHWSSFVLSFCLIEWITAVRCSQKTFNFYCSKEIFCTDWYTCLTVNYIESFITLATILKLLNHCGLCIFYLIFQCQFYYIHAELQIRVVC